MPIFDQGYHHWNGRLSGHASRWLAVAREGVRVQWRKRGTKTTVLVAFAPAIVLAAALFLWSLIEQGSSLLEPILPLLRALPEELRAGPRTYRTAFWTMAFEIFFWLQTFFTMLLVAVVGPDLISQDLRFNAMPLYLSRPLRRFDYFLGKLAVIGFYLSLVAFGPALIAYLIGFAFSFELSVIRETGRLFLATIAYGLIFVLSAGTIMLAISSLTRNSRFVGALWFAFWILSGIAADALTETVRKDWCPLVSYVSNLSRVREALLGTPQARDQFLELAGRTRDAAKNAARATMLGPGAFLLKPPPPPKPQPPPEPPEWLKLNADKFPWTWSAGVLAGLFALSVLTLSTRIKSLDRLK